MINKKAALWQPKLSLVFTPNNLRFNNPKVTLAFYFSSNGRMKRKMTAI